MKSQNDLRIHMLHHGTEEGQGRERRTYSRNVYAGRPKARRYVYKFVHNEYSDANYREASRYKQAKATGDSRLARCRLLPNGVLVMEYLEHWSKSNARVPDEMTYRAKEFWDHNPNGPQVGVNRKGEVKIFDYAQ